MKSLWRWTFLVVAASTVLYSGACSSDEDSHEEDEANPALADVVYEGGTNDEALEALLAGTPVEDAAKGASLTSPAEGASVPSSPPHTFTWSSTTARLEGGAVSPANRALDHWLQDLFAGERSALAHGNPVNGRAYFVVFSTSGDDKVLRVFTTSTSYTPDEAAWEKLVSAGGLITASITTGVYDNNAVASDGGPFTAPSATFTVDP